LVACAKFALPGEIAPAPVIFALDANCVIGCAPAHIIARRDLSDGVLPRSYGEDRRKFSANDGILLGDQKFVRSRAVREHRPVGRAGAGGSEMSRIVSPHSGSPRGQQLGALPGSGYSGGLRFTRLNQRGVHAVAIARDVAGFSPATAAMAAEADASDPSDGGCSPRG
jgi:hypothetical protein